MKIMKIINGKVIVGSATNISNPLSRSIQFRDSDSTYCSISLETVVRLYEIAKLDVERRGENWESFCDLLFKEKDNNG